MKKLGFMLIPVSLLVLLSGCSVFVKEVDYQPIADALNEKNMDRILNAVDGYAEITQTAVMIKTVSGEENEIKKEKDKLSFWGVYNTSDNTAVGLGITKLDSIVERDNEEEVIGTEESSEFPLHYSGNQYLNPESKQELDWILMIDKLQGIEKIEPTRFDYGLDVPPMVYYELDEQDFNAIINDDLKIDYDAFNRTNISFELDEFNGELYVTTISINISFGKLDNESKMVDYYLNNRVSTYIENEDAKKEYDQLING